MWTEIYQAHFQHYFNKPFDIQVFHDDEGFALKLATHDLAMHGFVVYASMGLADVLARNDEEDFGEVILFADVKDKEIPRLFINSLFFILQRAIPLGSRFSIKFGDQNHPLAKRFGKTAFYFTHPAIPDGFFAIDPMSEQQIGKDTFDKVRRGDSFGRVYQAFFITAEEDKYLDEAGTDALEEKLFEEPGAALGVKRE